MKKEITLEDNVKPCPRCGSTRYIVKSHYDIYVECKDCNHKGPGAEKLYDAIRLWNR
jgi:Lar family restriction alleviation protein